MKRKRIKTPTISTKCLHMKGIRTLQEAANDILTAKQKLNKSEYKFRPFDLLVWKWKYQPINGIIKIML